MEQTPWWAAGLFALIGVIVSQLATFLFNKSRVKYEDSRRWHEDRKQLYLQVSRRIMQVQWIYFERFERGTAVPADTHTLIEELWQDVQELSLIGSREVIQQVRHIMSEIGDARVAERANDAGKTLDHCDNIRHSLCLLEDMARADLTSDDRDLKHWKKVTILSHWSPKQKEKVSRLYPGHQPNKE